MMVERDLRHRKGDGGVWVLMEGMGFSRRV